MLGHSVASARRRGKLLLLDTDGPILGLRFGMTGRLLVDGGAPVGGLEYGPDRFDAAWIRFSLGFAEGGSLALEDARRLGGVELWPDEGALGPDALSVTRRELASMLSGVRAPLKAALMDQHRLAGIGNLLADEILWRAGLDPARPAGTLDASEVTALAAHHPADAEAPDGPRREPHRRSADRPPAGRAVPPGRHAARAPHGGWTHDVLLPRASALRARRARLLGS